MSQLRVTDLDHLAEYQTSLLFVPRCPSLVFSGVESKAAAGT